MTHDLQWKTLEGGMQGVNAEALKFPPEGPNGLPINQHTGEEDERLNDPICEYQKCQVRRLKPCIHSSLSFLYRVHVTPGFIRA